MAKIIGKENFNDYLVGTNQFDQIYGLSGNDTLVGLGGTDYLYGGNGNDYLYGGAGNDYLYGGSGHDYIDGGSGTDIVYYDHTSVGMTADLIKDTVTSPSSTYTETIKNIEGVVGSHGRDYLYGDHSSNVLSGRNGNDSIHGRGGNDNLYGEQGNDLIHGGKGNDNIIGGAGYDNLRGGQGADKFIFLNKNEGVDTITDFNRYEGDKIQISKYGFGATSTSQFSYNSSNGGLFFDASPHDGVGATKIATLENKPYFSTRYDIVLT
ncbi:MAG: calcium-binding protein [Cyanobacteria bacterium P01_D01_bin.116]